MLVGSSRSRVAVYVPVLFVVVMGLLAGRACYELGVNFSGKNLALALLCLGLLLLVLSEICVLLVEEDELRVWRPFSRASLPASTCGFSVKAKPGAKATTYQVQAVDEVRRIDVALLFTGSGARRFVRKLESILFHDGPARKQPPAVLADLAANKRERELEHAAAQKAMRTFWIVQLGFLALSLLGALGWLIWSALQ
jgi:hypothetical protein